MKTPISLALLALAVLGAGCSSTSDPGTSSVPQTSTTRAASSELDAWRQCIIDRIGRINSEVNQEIEEIDVRLEELSENLAVLPEQLRRLDSERARFQDIFDRGTEMLNASGIPGTLNQLRREDPEIAKALIRFRAAFAKGESSVEAFGDLSSAQRADLGAVMERESRLADLLLETSNEAVDVLKLQDELSEERDGLEAQREELIAEREDTMTTLQAALEDGQQSGEVDWSLCTGS